MAAKKQVQLELNLNSKDLQRDLKKAAKEVGELEEGFEDTESAGKAMAKVISRSADDMIDEIEKTQRAVEELERALGPDFDGDTREVVADLKRLGLTAEDVEQDADELAAALKRAGDVNLKATEAGFKDLDQALGNTSDEIGRTGDTMHGFIGGTVGELPMISESMGPIAEGLGQLTEGALAGEVNFKQLAVAGGAMLGVGFVLNKVNAHLQKMEEFKAWKTEQVEAYTDALEDTTSEAAAVEKKLRQIGEIRFNTGGLINFDFTPLLARAGVGIDQFSVIVAGGTEKIDAWEQQMKEAGVSAELYSPVVAVARQESEWFAEAQEAAAVNAEFFGTEAENAATKVNILNESIRVNTERINANIEAERNAAEARRGRTDTAYAAKDAEDAWIDSVDNLNTVMGDAESTERDRAAAVRDTTEATSDMIIKQMEAEGIIVDSADGQAEYFDRMQANAKFMGGPLERELMNYMAIQGGIPKEKITEIMSQIDQGHMETARRMLDQELGTTLSQIEFTGAEAQRTRIEGIMGRTLRTPLTLDLQPLTVHTRTNSDGTVRFFRRGTTYAEGGPAVVGEEGPELVNLPRGSEVIPADRSRKMLRNANGGRPVINNFYFPAGSTPKDVKAAQRRYDRVQGPR